MHLGMHFLLGCVEWEMLTGAAPVGVELKRRRPEESERRMRDLSRDLSRERSRWLGIETGSARSLDMSIMRMGKEES